VAPWRRKFSRLNVLFICYGTAYYIWNYWFRNLVQYFPSWDTPYMKYDVPHILMIIEEWRQRYRNGHLEIRKMKIKEANLFNTFWSCILKKMVKSVIYLLFSYLTGYIMWHSNSTVFSFMKYDATHMLTSLKNDVKAQGHLEIRKMKIKDANLFNTVEFCI
jgi:hypothetical protein